MNKTTIRFDRKPRSTNENLAAPGECKAHALHCGIRPECKHAHLSDALAHFVSNFLRKVQHRWNT